MNNNFRITIRSTTDEQEKIHTALGAAITGWSDDGEEEQDEEFLLPKDEDDDAEEDDEQEHDEDEDEEEADVPGRLTLQVQLTADAFADCQLVRQSDEVAVVIAYVSDAGVPVYQHEYTLDSMYLVQMDGTASDEPLTLELTGLYTDCIQFVAPEPVAVH